MREAPRRARPQPRPPTPYPLLHPQADLLNSAESQRLAELRRLKAEAAPPKGSSNIIQARARARARAPPCLTPVLSARPVLTAQPRPPLPHSPL